MGTKQLFLVAFLFSGVTALQVTNSSKNSLRCDDSTLRDVQTEKDLYDRLLPKVIRAGDDDSKIKIKRKFLQYLTQSRTFLEIIRCTNPGGRISRQEDEDGDDGDDAGGAAGVNPLLDNTSVINGVRRILANVFTGNLIGVIQEGVALRGPEPVTTVFTDVLSTLFGSTATAGITGIIGNITTAAPPVVQNTTLNYEEQKYLLQQQQYLLAQQQGLAGRPGQGFPGPGGIQGQRLPPGPPAQHPPSGYPQFQPQQQTFPNQVAGAPPSNIKRPATSAGAVGQVSPQQPFPPQNQPLLAGGLDRQHQQLPKPKLPIAAAPPQPGGGAVLLQGQKLPVVGVGLPKPPQNVKGSTLIIVQPQQLAGQKPPAVSPPTEDDEEDNDEEEEE